MRSLATSEKCQALKTLNVCRITAARNKFVLIIARVTLPGAIVLPAGISISIKAAYCTRMQGGFSLVDLQAFQIKRLWAASPVAVRASVYRTAKIYSVLNHSERGDRGVN